MQHKARQNLSIVMLGHVDSGKTTLVGQLLYQTKSPQHYQSFQNGQAFRFFIKNVLRENHEEKIRRLTINIHYYRLNTKRGEFSLIDVPGHRDFMKNTIKGIVQADIAILVVACAPGEFQAGISSVGQTLEHALLAYIFGIRRLIVCFNKADYCYSSELTQQKFNQLKQITEKKLKNIGFSSHNISFIPMLAWKGDNVVFRSEKWPWYKGPTIMETIDAVEEPKRFVENPLRFGVRQIVKVSGVGLVALGKVFTGTLVPGQQLFCPNSKQIVTAVSIEEHCRSLKQGKVGQRIGIRFKEATKINQIIKGEVLSLSTNPLQVSNEFVAQIIILNHPGFIGVGYTPIIHCHFSQVACRIVKIVAKVDKKSGKTIEESPQYLRRGQCALVLMRPLKPICVETYKECSYLGRFAMRDGRMTVGVGAVQKTML